MPNYRFDVPVFGMKTIEVMSASGISTACLEVDATIILDRASVIEQAVAGGIELYGYLPPD